MSIVAGYVCDNCGRASLFKHEAKKYILRWARRAGWTVGKRVLCPYCKPKKEVKE